jgi:uncharacterized membrane protein
VIGWCMALLAGLIFLPVRALAAFGLVVVLGHNILDHFSQSLFATVQQSHWGWLWQILYFGGPIQIGEHGPTLFVLYSIVPWVGVMALGYGFGRVMIMDQSARRKICLALGSAAIALFLVLRGFNLYGDPRPWVAPANLANVQSQTSSAAAPANPASQQTAPVAPPRRQQAPAWISFLNTTKYPASLLFLLMTLGPMLLVLPFLENAGSRVTNVLKIFGRVPFFYYVLHIPLIHFAAMIVSLLRTGSVAPWLFMNHPVMNPPAPPGYVWSIGLLYLVWLMVVMVLYLPCQWFAGLKQRRKDIGFLSYL